MKKLNNTEAELKKSVAYKKSVYYIQTKKLMEIRPVTSYIPVMNI